MARTRVQHLAGMVAVGMLLAPGLAWAWGKENPEEAITHRMERMTKRLSLTSDQAQKVRAILESAHATMEADHKVMQQHREQASQQVLAVLNDQQKAQYAKMKEARKEKREEKRDQQRHHEKSSQPATNPS